jgi:hypothetical protein
MTKGFPVLTYGDDPQISDEWQIKVWGKAKPVTFTC